MTPSRIPATGEHEHEPEHGLPEPLPPGEHILWQGAPRWRALAVQAFHLRKVALYFGVLLAWRVLSALADGASAGQAAAALLWPLPLAAAGLGLLAFLAWLSARSTAYTLTDKRLVLRVGIVLTVTFNLPLSRIEAAALRLRRGGVGDICLRLDSEDRIGYLHLWPHVRPWRLRRTEPMMRALPEAATVARQVAAALQATLDAGARAAAVQAAAAAAPAPVVPVPSAVPDGAPVTAPRHPPRGLQPAAA